MSGLPVAAPTLLERAGRAGRAGSLLAVLAAGLIWVALLAPIIALLLHLSPSSIVSSLTASGAFAPTVISLEASGTTVGVLILAGTPLAWLLAHDRLPLPRLWEAGLLASLLLPPLVIGLLLIFMVGPLTPIGAALSVIHLSASNTFFALVVAEVYESAPYYVLGALTAFRSVDGRLEEQAAILGDRPGRAFLRVTLPLAAGGLAMALATAWARSIGAFGAVIIIAYHPFGLPLQIWTTLQETGLASALPFALVLLVVALPLPLLVYGWSARAQGRDRG
ncbi:MAG TPA: ABC transporter permease subunit [Candidatus Dormibacteraeota bacterium]|nr:ABC transporter permease subunit [Candidatus Dormibacteraeota bacterium]